MTRRRTTALVAAAAALLLALAPAADAAVPDRPAADRGADTLHVMSFNLRYASDTPPNSWPERRPVMRELLRDERPDVIGTQEGLYAQLTDIQADLGRGYGAIGLGREGGSKGEFMMVFYNTRRLQALAYDHYWLSDTPDVVGSKTWGGCCPRMVTWVLFRDLRTGKQFYVLNTHLEAFDATARAKSADLILQRMQRDFDPALPVVATADFNEPGAAGQTVYDKLVTAGPFDDTWVTAARRSPLFATFHGYRPLVPDGDRIDWILSTPGVTTSEARINTFSADGQFPSDHLPVQAFLTLPR